MVVLKVRKNKEDIATIFLKEFTKQLIINSKPISGVNPEIIERVKKKLENKMGIEIKPLKTVETIQSPKISPISPRNNPTILKRRPLVLQQNNKQIMPKPTNIVSSKPPIIAKVPVKSQISAITVKESSESSLNLGKLSNIFADPRVTGIECPGPNKTILVNRSGMVQPFSIMLNEEEIKSILTEFSSKTKIPLVNGIFKALYNNILITAVISDIAGNRFIMEKHFGQPNLPRKER